MARDEMMDKGKGPDEKMKIARPRRRIYEAPAEEAAPAPGAKEEKKPEPVAARVAEPAVVAVAPAASERDAPAQDTVRPEALDIIKSQVIYSMGVAAAPVPLLDIAGVFAVVLKMLKKLAGLYGVDYSKRTAMRMTTCAVGSAGPLLASGLGTSLLMGAAPMLGAVAGLTSRPILSGATVYGIGMMFARHFEKGGTLEDMTFGPTRDYFKEKYGEGKAYVSSLHSV
ncbi:MAG: DUF697 domain-containing protein [Nitrospinae bacterium]|nr:DUF697 domain-containing protein [Nitrospinota bacterium]